MVDQGIGIMVAVVLIGGVAIPVTASALVLDTNSVVNETEDSTGSVPEIVTANEVANGDGQAVVSDSESLVINDSLDNSLTTIPESNYTADYEAGEFNVTDNDPDADGTPEINSTSDTYRIDYEYEPQGYVGGTTNTVLGFIPLALGVALFVAAISIVR